MKNTFYALFFAVIEDQISKGLLLAINENTEVQVARTVSGQQQHCILPRFYELEAIPVNDFIIW